MKKVILIVLGVALLFVSGVFFYSRLAPDGEKELMKLPFSSLRAAKNAIDVPDQKSPVEVRVNFAVMAEGGYVAIHDDEAGPGKILGYSVYLPPGETQDFPIGLSVKLTPGYYYAVLHSDDGDGAFDPANDAPLRDDRGNAVMDRFLVN